MKVVVFGDSILKGVITIPESKNLFDVTPNDALTYAQKKLGFELEPVVISWPIKKQEEAKKLINDNF